MQYSDTANASFWTISSRIMATMSTFIINCTTKHQHKVEEVAPEESSIYWWKTSEISHFTFLCLNHRSFIRIFSNCRFLDQTWPCFNLHVTDPLRTVTEMSEALAEPCAVIMRPPIYRKHHLPHRHQCRHQNLPPWPLQAPPVFCLSREKEGGKKILPRQVSI